MAAGEAKDTPGCKADWHGVLLISAVHGDEGRDAHAAARQHRFDSECYLVRCMQHGGQQRELTTAIKIAHLSFRVREPTLVAKALATSACKTETM